jgi:flagellin
MSYLLTNASALTALQNLTMTQNSLATTQSQLSTGLSIQNASDNSSYWSIAQTMSSDNGALGAASSAMGVSASMLATFNSAVNQAISVVNNIKNDLTNAQNPNANLTQIQTDINAQQTALFNIAGASEFSGQNWMNGTINGSTAAAAQTTTTLVGGYTFDSGISTISIDLSQVNMFTSGTAANNASGGLLGTTQAASSTAAGFSGGYSVLGATGAGGSVNVTNTAANATSDIQNMLASVNTTLTKLETAASTIGAAQNEVTIMSSFAATMQTNLQNGVAALVDANMNQVSTRLQALQTQQQLGVQSLSIANQSSSMILKLFQ